MREVSLQILLDGSTIEKTCWEWIPYSSCTPTSVLANGDIEIGVHIADVTHFVPHNSPLDIEAQIRGTTFYLVDRRFDMLPTLLSSGRSFFVFLEGFTLAAS